MNLRAWLGAVLGLTLLVQGVAVASAPLGLPADAREAPAPEAAAPQVAEEMPCHGAMLVDSAPDAAPESAPDSAPCACCDADCVAMGACAFGHIAVASAVLVNFVPAPQPAIAAPERAVPSVSISSRLRPPIVLHA
jgi:hypothetical protein